MIDILLLEDRVQDALLVASRLEEIDARVRHVASGPAYEEALLGSRFDAVLSDYEVPGFSGERALLFAREHAPDVPFLFVSGALGEERAIELLKAGATDYVLKDGLHRLVPSLRRALREAEERRIRLSAEEEARRRAEIDQLLVGIVSHDLRDPLAAIQFAAHTLQAEELPPRAARNVARILSASGRAERLIRNLLDLTAARLGGGISVAPVPMDLSELARNVVEELSAVFPERVIRLEAPPLVAGVWDADRIGQVISNLVANAMQHGGGSAVLVRVESGEDGALLSVHNDGDPIPVDVLPRIFEALQRAGDRRGGSGVGLGLFIVDQIARAHGGAVDVDSRPGHGTTFCVRLPRQPAAVGASAGSSNSPGTERYRSPVS